MCTCTCASHSGCLACSRYLMYLNALCVLFRFSKDFHLKPTRAVCEQLPFVNLYVLINFPLMQILATDPMVIRKVSHLGLAASHLAVTTTGVGEEAKKHCNFRQDIEIRHNHSNTYFCIEDRRRPFC